MKKSIRFINYFPLLAVSFLLLSCGSAPLVKDSKVLISNVEKTHSLKLIYLNAEMKITSSNSYGKGAIAADTGFNGFGSLIVKQAEPAFSQRGVEVVDAKVLNGKEPILVDPPPNDTGSAALPILIIAPTTGKISTNGRATNTSYVFSALLIDPNTKRTIWKATIDTKTWSGQDIVLKNFKKTLYDESYALQLLNIVADQMKQDGVI